MKIEEMVEQLTFDQSIISPEQEKREQSYTLVTEALWTGWLAGIIDGEGSISAHKYTEKRSKRGYNIHMVVVVAMTSLQTLERIVAVSGVGKVQHLRSHNPKYRNVYRWTVVNGEAAIVLRRCLSALVTKRAQAELALDLERVMSMNRSRHRSKSGRNGIPLDQFRERERLYLELHALNARGQREEST